jgi:hypothetical protein
MNNNLILVTGFSGTGKSMSLSKLENPEGVLYLNCESNKSLPFKNGNKFINKTITDPYKVYDYINQAVQHSGKVHTIAIDTVTFLMNMYESNYIVNSANSQKAWGDYAQFFMNLMQQYIAVVPQRVVLFGHTAEMIDNDKISHVAVKVKGSLMNNGIESFFSNVISTKKMPIKKLLEYKEGNDLLTFTPKEELLGIKHVFQTQLTKETINERIRGPEEPPMWSVPETFINNDLELVFKRIKEYNE